MGLSLLLPKGTETAMFPHQTPLFMCTILLPSVLSQTFFQTNHGGAGGSFTSFSLGAATANLQSASYVPQPKPVVVKQPAYSAPQPTYSQATTYVKPQPAYIQPKTYIQPQTYAQPQTYSAPKSYAPQPTSYHHTPKSYPAPQGPKPAYGDKCTLDYVDEKAEICIPTFKADCSREEESKPGLMVRQEKECHTITRTICVEREEVEENEICAYSFHPVPVDTEVKLADVKWEKVCKDEPVCLSPQHVSHSYGAPAKCIEEYRHICHLNPVLYPIYKKVTVKLPQPIETCITKPVLLPRIECDQVREKRCMAVPVAEERKGVKLHKCTIEQGSPDCQDSYIQLPRQACLGKITKVKTIYEVEETVSYAG